VDPGTVLLDFDAVLPPQGAPRTERGFAASTDLAGALAFERPRAVITASELSEVRRALARVDEAAGAGRWVAGFVAYEAAPALDSALRARPRGPLPLVWFGVYDAPGSRRPEPAAAALGPLVPDVERAAYARSVQRIRERIARGDVYQVNHTFRLRGPFEGDPLALYLRLRTAQGGGLGALVHLGARAIVSASPELFVERRGDLVRARPMKGTARRGRYEEEDAAAVEALTTSAKERAENVMIADLLRNDLGRVARIGTVEVPRLVQIERYRTVLQLTSTIEARLRTGVGIAELFAAAFPCGSVTGAPKSMATRIIAEEETSARGTYCGAIGAVAPGGDAVFNVGIRTVELDLERNEAVAGVGGGITWASSVEDEYDEALAKGAFLTERVAPFELVETLRLEGGVYPLLARHLARLASSARHLGFPLDRGAVEAALGREAAAGEPRRVRLLLAEDGGVRTESAALPSPAAEPMPVALATARVSRHDPALFHKTTRREPYDAARRERPDAFDVLLSNAEGELTEFTIGNLVLEVDGERVTPRLDGGLLPGVMRAELLARGEVRERTVRVEDLGRARRLWLVNAVRGWVPVRLLAR
jgi:para-aminobenzoate synthetase/4-amino-4-deoxychorismate lyase